MEPFIIIWTTIISALTLTSCVEKVCELWKYKIDKTSDLKSNPPIYTEREREM